AVARVSLDRHSGRVAVRHAPSAQAAVERQAEGSEPVRVHQQTSAATGTAMPPSPTPGYGSVTESGAVVPSTTSNAVNSGSSQACIVQVVTALPTLGIST